MFEITTLMVLVPALPLLASLLVALFGRTVFKTYSHLPIVVALAGSFICSGGLLRHVARANDNTTNGFELTHNLWNWVAIDGASADGTFDFIVDVTLRLDPLTAVMLVMVTFISTLVALFAAGYMKGDPGYPRFFALIGLFVFSMTMLVSVSNFLLLYVFWEAVGVCSYLLIGFWFSKPSAAAAGKKAFLVNRIGDFGFALAVFLIWTSYGTLNFHDVQRPMVESSAAVHEILFESKTPIESANTAYSPMTEKQFRDQFTKKTDQGTMLLEPGVFGQARLNTGFFVTGTIATAICLLLLVGACGKSAQFPLHVWLPDAMEGPTPVSALIHAATMVTAGIYMITRCTPLFLVSEDARLVVACIGCGTALMAGMIAMTQTDLKRVLAYSTVSQLGYMVLGLGTGTLAGIIAGMFHLLTHAFFKSLLFLGSGSVMHAMGGVVDMRRFGGLRKIMPVTCCTFFVGCLALAGVPPLSGFFSKDAIIAAVHDVSTVDHTYHYLYLAALATALLTSMYTFRAFFLTFFGPTRVPPEAAGHAHESPASMTIPLVILAVFAAAIGGLLQYSGQLIELLSRTPSLAYPRAAATRVISTPGAFHTDVALVSAFVALLGIGLAAFFYLGGGREIGWLTSLMKFQWLAQFANADWAGRLRGLAGVEATYRGTQKIGLGGPAKFFGYVVLLVVFIFMVPVYALSWLAPYRLSYHKFYFDEIYNVVIIWPLRGLASVCDALDRFLVDGLVNLIGRMPPLLGRMVRPAQNGLVPFYALAMVLGLLASMVAVLMAS